MRRKKQGRETLLSLGRQVFYGKNSLLKTDALGRSAHCDGVMFLPPMMDNTGYLRVGALPVESP
ncbi:hypothetical protein DPMN_051428 [Dreissena polymorpha]|uniref:Uncharacterized protein n=1 Tax=Dreissena polymorpha TaxID=45954 RepID=A0A9D4CIJ5_DREPO|nr:hypothetical protein DPMN_051428 [Dreissena polymorpha]